ncbi:CRISPR-associated protein Csm3 [Thermonema lapsum]|uniref:CRISPR system Cms endoribonuclease Csm3 n=1 Tax=Thermonema lapsum TaxID=28195 RepID=A0A846MQU0_9BACT|nr:type III-A CRISPR-associated RAMP protein Csm3 [Thermonema lapsum]NIK73933.1 CRISPR-associated protein Csm3 [Thermonema lapsum]
MSNTSQYPQLVANIILRGKIKVETGLHIGGSKEKLEIGGVDSPVVRDPRTRYPYLPGSSIKGKMRSLLEYFLGVVDKDGKVSTAEEVVRIFGKSADEEQETGPTRLVVRDAMPDEATVEMWKNLDSELLYTEYKAENTLNRLTSAANPRFIERVVPGSTFNLEMVFTVLLMEENDLEKIKTEDLKRLCIALKLLENNYLGKSGSRGYGKVKLLFAPPVVLSREDYEKGAKDKFEALQKSLGIKDCENTTSNIYEKIIEQLS